MHQLLFFYFGKGTASAKPATDMALLKGFILVRLKPAAIRAERALVRVGSVGVGSDVFRYGRPVGRGLVGRRQFFRVAMT
jgi:hypothetical protein